MFLSGEYRGHEGVRRLYGTWFQKYFTQGEVGPVYGFLLDHFQMQDIITIAPDRKTAKGRLRGVLLGGWLRGSGGFGCGAVRAADGGCGLRQR